MNTKTKTLTALAVAAALGGTALADASYAGHRDGGHGMGFLDKGQFAVSAMEMFDADGDGSLSLEKFTGLWHETTRPLTVRAFTDPSRGVDMALQVHGIAGHAEDGYREWGVSGPLKHVPGAAGRGLSMSLTPYSVGPGGSERLWMLPDVSGLAANDDAPPSSRLDADLGYGLSVFSGGFTGTPNVGLGLSDAARDYRIGWRLTSALEGDPGFEISLGATPREATNDDAAEHGILLRSAIRW